MFLLAGTMTLTSCAVRLVDFTIISSKNVSLDINKAEGKQVEGSKSYFLGFGWNIKDALDEALEEAGPEYDLLVDGVVRYTSYPFIVNLKVEGTAVSSRAMKNKMGEAGFQEWLKGHEVVSENSEVVGM